MWVGQEQGWEHRLQEVLCRHFFSCKFHIYQGWLNLANLVLHFSLTSRWWLTLEEKKPDSSWQVIHGAGVNVLWEWCFWAAWLLLQREYSLSQVLPHPSCGPSYLHEENHLWKDSVIFKRKKGKLKKTLLDKMLFQLFAAKSVTVMFGIKTIKYSVRKLVGVLHCLFSWDSIKG